MLNLRGALFVLISHVTGQRKPFHLIILKQISSRHQRLITDVPSFSRCRLSNELLKRRSSLHIITLWALKLSSLTPRAPGGAEGSDVAMSAERSTFKYYK